MNKIKALAAVAISLCGLGLVQPASAQRNAPIGHLQPNASDVPTNDTYRATADTPAKLSKKRARSRRDRSRTDVIMKTPNICSNCNQ